MDKKINIKDEAVSVFWSNELFTPPINGFDPHSTAAKAISDSLKEKDGKTPQGDVVFGEHGNPLHLGI